MRYATTKGHVVESDLSDTDAVNVLIEKSVKGDFADSLISATLAGRLTDKQRPWLHKLAQDALNQAEQVRHEVGEATAHILSRLNRGALHVEHPRIKVWDEPGTVRQTEYVFTLAGADSRNAGSAYVKRAGEYLGRLAPDGVFISTSGRGRVREGDRVLSLLKEINERGDEFFAENGRASGRCCFCSTKLTTPESLTAGYGPICAQHYGLPWGEVEVDRRFNDVKKMSQDDLDELRKEFDL